MPIISVCLRWQESSEYSSGWYFSVYLDFIIIGAIFLSRIFLYRKVNKHQKVKVNMEKYTYKNLPPQSKADVKTLTSRQDSFETCTHIVCTWLALMRMTCRFLSSFYIQRITCFFQFVTGLYNLTQRIWIINRSPRSAFCHPELLQILFPCVLSPPPPPCNCWTLPTRQLIPLPQNKHRVRIWSSFGRQKVEHGLLLSIHILWSDPLLLLGLRST